MDKKLKKAIIVVSILLIIVILWIISIINKSKEDPKTVPSPPQKEDTRDLNSTLTECKVTNDYFAVRDAIDLYYSYCSSLNQKTSNINSGRAQPSAEQLEKTAEEIRENSKKSVYNVLNTEYMEEYKISEDDIAKKFTIENPVETIIKEIYSLDNSINVSTFLVSGIIIDKEKQEKSDFQIAVNLDKSNNTFSIIPEEYIKDHGYDKLEIGDSINLEIKDIEKNSNNTVNYRIIQDNEVSQEYYNKYKYLMLYDVDYAYEMLTEEYKESRFNTIDKFKKYVNENHDILNNSILINYEKKGNEKSKKFICKDNFDKYYIFEPENLSKNHVCLDTYTIETEEFLEKYNKENEKVKAGMNAEKFFEALNNQDYDFIYNHLDDTFKSRYFPNTESLAKFLRENLFKYNEKEYTEFSNEGEIIIIKASVKDKLNKESVKNMNFIFKIKENTDFDMSFSLI